MDFLNFEKFFSTWRSACSQLGWRMRSRLFSGEVPAPSTLIAVYLVARVSLDALAGLAPHYAGAQSSHAAVKRGALSALVESVCVWGVCHALVKTRVFEPKTLPRPQLLALSASFALAVLAMHVCKEQFAQQAESMGRLVLPSMSLVVAAAEGLFFRRIGGGGGMNAEDDDGGQWYLAVVVVALTPAQYMVMRANTRWHGDAVVSWHALGAGCLVQCSWALLAFVLWRRARAARLSPLQALHKCAAFSLPIISLLSLFLLLTTTVASSPTVPSPSAASLVRKGDEVKSLRAGGGGGRLQLLLQDSSSPALGSKSVCTWETGS